MNICPYCGREYADEVERCLIDDHVLPGTGPDKPPVLVTEPPSLPPEKFWTERQLLILEVLVVCLITFGSAIIASSYHFIYGYSDTTRETTGSPFYSWSVRIEREVVALGLVWYLLLRRGKTFKDLGLVWVWKDLGWAIFLICAGSLAFKGIYEGIHFAGLASFTRQANDMRVGDILFGGGVSLMTFLFQIVNPFFEELIVRAYLMTQVRFLTGSVWTAILISTILQTSYHFYQGAPAAFGHAGTFLIFSIFYAKTKRITPVIFAHLYSDVGGTVWYLVHR